MAHSHSHEPSNYNRAFVISVTLNSIFVIIEAVYGILANSLALLADAGHNLSDVLGLLLAWGASFLARRRPTSRRTYGLRRSSILAALLNAVLLLVASGGIGWEAIQRFRQPALVEGGTLIAVAAVGIAINMGSALMFLSESLNLIMDAVPEGIEPLAVRTYLAELPGVSEVHDLHIWGVSTTETALTAHLIIPSGHPGDTFLAQIAQGLRERFSIEHPTIQIELGDSCSLESDNRF